MKKFQTLLNILSHVPKRVFAIFGIVAMSAAVLVPAAINAWGPDRPTFTDQTPPNYITFNSILSSAGYGDERDFVNVKDKSDTSYGNWKNEIQVEKGKTYRVRMFVHNNANPNLNLVANNVRATAAIDNATPKTTNYVSGYINADNANPTEYWDDIKFVSDKPFNLAYVPGSAQYFNNWTDGKTFAGSTDKGYAPLSDALFSNAGVKLGYNNYDPATKQFDGKIPGCYEYSGYVFFDITPQFAEEIVNSFEIQKEVAKIGDTSWSESVNVKPGEVVNYLIDYTNTSSIQQNDVVIKDYLPAGLTYIAGSTKVFNSTNPDGLKVSDNIVSNSGINIGNYKANAGAYVMFKAQVVENDMLPECGVNVLRNIGRVTVDGRYKEDPADVTVTRECEEEVPTYVCELLSADRISIKPGEKVNFTVTPRFSGDVRVKEYKINFGDASDFTQTNNTFEHIFAKVGVYTVKAHVTFEVEGQTVAGITSAACTKTVKVTDTPPIIERCPIKGKEHLNKDDPNCYDAPKELPKTGGELGVAIGISSVATAAAYYVASRRRIS